MTSRDSKRKTDIMFLNIVFCMLVMFIHIASEVVIKMPKEAMFFKIVFIAQRLSYFVVPGFILLSGVRLFLNNGSKINYPKYYASRIYRIFLPYVAWAIIYYLWLCFKGVYAFDIKTLLVGILTGEIWAHLYFVIVLMQFIILTPVWMWFYKSGTEAVHIAFSVIITIISVMYLPSVLTRVFPDIPDFNLSNNFLSYLVYWTAGCLIGKNYNMFRSYLQQNKIMITLSFLICGAIEGFLSLLTIMAEPVWLELFEIMYIISAILFFYMISQLFCGRAKVLLKPMSILDRSSYMVYLMHCLVIAIADDAMTARGVSDLETRFGIRVVVVYTVTFLICIAWRIFRGFATRKQK